MVDVADWLHGLGLGQYADAFRANDVDDEILPELTVDDNLAGSTELATQLDPEDLREIITAYHGRVTAVVNRFGGFVAKAVKCPCSAGSRMP